MKPKHLWIRDGRRSEGFREAAGKTAPRWAKASGQAMLELCLILPALLLLLLGTIEFGRAAYFDIEVADAARAGALYGAQSMAEAADQQNIKQAVLNNAQDVPNASTALMVTSGVSCTCAGSGGVTGSCSGTLGCAPQIYVNVEAQYQLQTLFQYPGIPGSFNFRTTSVMPVRQQ